MNMLLHCGLLLLFLNCVRTTEYVYPNGAVKDLVAEFNDRFSWWPSVHNAANLVVKVKRQAGQVPQPQIISEGGDKPPSSTSTAPPVAAAAPKSEDTHAESKETATTSTTVSDKPAVVKAPPVTNTTEIKASSTPEKPKQLDLKNPGVLKRGIIVFGGFALLAIAYFVFYRRKSKNNDTGNAHSSNDANQFRYGVLQSEDRRDNLELSRVPLTMESDEDEDEDLEIFDLEQKKKSLSYVNLQTNDEDIVFSNRDNSDDRENLLLDIEDGTSQTLINWSSSGSKSIL